MEVSEIENIQAEFRRSDEAKYIHRLHGVLLVLGGLSTVKAAALLHEPQRTVAEWMKRYRQGGVSGLRDAAKSGRPSLLSSKELSALKKALKQSPAKLGLAGDTWTGELLSEYVKQQFRIEMTIRNSRRILRKLEGSTAQNR